MKTNKQYHKATAGWFTWSGHRGRLSYLGSIGCLVVVGILLPMIFSALTMSDTNTILINLSIGLIIAGLLSYPITVQRIRDVVGSNNLYILSSLVATVVLPFVVFLWLVFPGRQGAK